MFLLVPAYPGCPRQTAVKWLLLLLSALTMHHRLKMVIYILAQRLRKGDVHPDCTPAKGIALVTLPYLFGLQVSVFVHLVWFGSFTYSLWFI